MSARSVWTSLGGPYKETDVSEIAKTTSTRTTLHDGFVSLEVKNEDEWPTRYTIYVGPREKQKQGRTRIEFAQENFAALRRLIAEAEAQGLLADATADVSLGGRSHEAPETTHES